jgi:hypothetical protein
MDTPTPQRGAMPNLMVVQTDGELVAEALADAGWNVVHHTNNPMPYLDNIMNLMSVSGVVVSPLAMGVEAIAQDVLKLIKMLPCYLYVAPDHWLELLEE